jgi:hypothetical protein
MSEHTPGPWVWTDYGELSGAGDVVMDADYFSEPSEADARLIAAAPDLLAACEAMLVELDEWEQELGRHPACDLARAAIAKAKGGES